MWGPYPFVTRLVRFFFVLLVQQEESHRSAALSASDSVCLPPFCTPAFLPTDMFSLFDLFHAAPYPSDIIRISCAWCAHICLFFAKSAALGTGSPVDRVLSLDMTACVCPALFACTAVPSPYFAPFFCFSPSGPRGFILRRRGRRCPSGGHSTVLSKTTFAILLAFTELPTKHV